MKYKTLLCVCFIVFGLITCREDKSYEYMSAGTITGPDLRMCPSPCCSGWYIVIDDTTYEFDTLPAASNINLDKETFPLKVKLDWQILNTINCPNARISIQRIAKEQ